MDDQFKLEFSVRDYECDLAGMVNNAAYLNYIEHARHEFLKTKNIDFADVHEFNDYQLQKYAAWSWPQLQKEAIDYASTFYALYEHPNLLTAEKSELTKPHRKFLRNGEILDDTTMGWCMWVIYLDHEAVEHAAELKLPVA